MKLMAVGDLVIQTLKDGPQTALFKDPVRTAL
jgi:hypothetical protein